MTQVVSLARAQQQVWRNGAGSTRELLAWPSPARWQWRVSVAEIVQDGPFSTFPGVQRWIAVTHGGGVLLRFAAHQVMLVPGSAPFSFEGAGAPYCELLDRHSQDLNLMVRHDAGSASLEPALAGTEWLSTAPLRALYSTGAVRLQIDDTDAAFVRADALAWSDHAARQRWRFLCDEAAGPVPAAWWLSFTPHAR
jgi:environmental stress-induced protein Ves